MRITTPEVVWHGGEAGKNDPILSVDVHPCGVLATGGADGEVRLWRLRLEENEESKFQEYLYAFENHERSVNAVRFSPDGRTLATASDGGNIILFCLPEGRPAHYWRRDVASRKIQAVLVRAAQADIYDIAWGPSSLEFASVSVDNRVCFWGVGPQGKAFPQAHFTSHQNYVQGVAWDPRDRYVVSQSNDRSCRVYKKREDPNAAAGAGGKKGGGKGKGKKARPVGPLFSEVSLMRLASRPEDVAKAKEDETCCIIQAKVSSPRRRADDDSDSDDDDDRPTAAAGAAAAATTTTTSSVNGQDAAPSGSAAASAPAPAPAPAPREKRTPRAHLFADETVPSFFRRPAWSPDGCLLLTPAGVHKRAPGDAAGGGKTEYATHVYSRESFAMPVLELPHPGCKASVAVRFCPQLFALKQGPPGAQTVASSPGKEEGKAEPGLVEAVTPPPPLTNLPYRMVFAVVTVTGVLVYDTQHHYPLAFVKNSHYAPLTDVAWLSDGRALVATSMDGYVTVLSFPDGELGVPLELEKVPPPARAMYKAYYDGVQKGVEGEEEERAAEEEERRQRAERKVAKEAARQEAKRKRKEEKARLLAAAAAAASEAGAEGLEGDGDEESTAASSSSSGGDASSSGKAASRASRPKTRGGGKWKAGADDGNSVVSLLDSESSDEEEEEAAKPAAAGPKRSGESDGESLKSEAMSEDEAEDEDEDEASEAGGGKWERVGDDDEEEDGSAASGSAARAKAATKKRTSSEMAPADDEEAEAVEAAEAPAAGAAAAEGKQPQAQPAAAAAGGKKKAAKRIKPTLVSVSAEAAAAGPVAAAAVLSSPASTSSASVSAAEENTPAVANTSSAPAAAAAAAPEGGAAAAAKPAKAKKRVAPMLVSKLN